MNLKQSLLGSKWLTPFLAILLVLTVVQTPPANAAIRVTRDRAQDSWNAYEFYNLEFMIQGAMPTGNLRFMRYRKGYKVSQRYKLKSGTKCKVYVLLYQGSPGFVQVYGLNTAHPCPVPDQGHVSLAEGKYYPDGFTQPPDLIPLWA